MNFPKKKKKTIPRKIKKPSLKNIEINFQKNFYTKYSSRPETVKVINLQRVINYIFLPVYKVTG